MKESTLNEVPKGVLDWMMEAHQSKPTHEPMFGLLCEVVGGNYYEGGEPE